MKKAFSILLIFAILVSLSGCSEEWRRKFIRKKKDVVKKPRIYQLKKYKKAPPPELYDKHYNYAITWLSELTGNLGQNSKKDIRCIEEALGQIRDMQSLLLPEKAAELDKHISRLKEVEGILIRQDMEQANKSYVQSTLDREERFLRSEFYTNKIKNFLLTSSEEDDWEETGG